MTSAWIGLDVMLKAKCQCQGVGALVYDAAAS